MIKLFLLVILLSAVFSKRISEEKCQKYKDLVKHEECHGYNSDTQNCTSRPVTYVCDISNTGFVIGGEEAKHGEFPHMAAIGWELPNGNLTFNCGGSLISERFVMTAAHCGWDRKLESPPVWVRLGVQNLAINTTNVVQLKIKNFIKHPEYNNGTKFNDIALIELEENVIFNNKTLRPACLQQEEYNETSATASGWGATQTGGSTVDNLMKVVLPIADPDKCNRTRDKEKTICAGAVDRDTCQGDSGGPIQYGHDGALCVYNIVGFTSFGNAVCGTGYAVYTKTMSYLDWIEKIVWPQEEESTGVTTS